MTCRDVESLLIPYASGAAIPPEAVAHIAGCELCQRLAMTFAKRHDVLPPSQELLRGIESTILSDLKPVKPLAAPGARHWLFMLIVVLAAMVGAATLGTAGWHALSIPQKLAVFAVLASGAFALGASASRQVIPGRTLVVPPYWLVAAVFGVFAGVVLGLFHPRPESTFLATGLVCIRIGLEYAVPSGALYWLLLRQGAILNPMLTAATTGALAGLTGLTVLEIFCPNLNEFHILTWHLGAALISAAAGFTIGRTTEHASRGAQPKSSK